MAKNEKKQQTMLVMTYGTLMRKKPNYSVMIRAGGKFIGVGKSIKPEFQMISIADAYPAIIDGDGYFTGEVFEVPTEGIEMYLNSLEGYPTFYDIEFIDVLLASGHQVNAMVYVLADQTVRQPSFHSYVEGKSSRVKFENNTYSWVGEDSSGIIAGQ